MSKAAINIIALASGFLFWGDNWPIRGIGDFQ
jgi:hypothetical protein